MRWPPIRIAAAKMGNRHMAAYVLKRRNRALAQKLTEDEYHDGAHLPCRSMHQ